MSKLEHLLRNKIFLYEESWNPTQLPQETVQAPVQNDIHHHVQEMLPEGTEAGCPISQVTQMPGPVCQCCHYISVSLSHLEDQGEKTVIHLNTIIK